MTWPNGTRWNSSAYGDSDGLSGMSCGVVVRLAPGRDRRDDRPEEREEHDERADDEQHVEQLFRPRLDRGERDAGRTTVSA